MTQIRAADRDAEDEVASLMSGDGSAATPRRTTTSARRQRTMRSTLSDRDAAERAVSFDRAVSGGEASGSGSGQQSRRTTQERRLTEGSLEGGAARVGACLLARAPSM
jgi:hypothetical protein